MLAFAIPEVVLAVVSAPMVTLAGPCAVVSAPGLLSPVVPTWFATAVMLHPPAKVSAYRIDIVEVIHRGSAAFD